MEKFTPSHPLPEEIQNMKRDDTVCQFCGVSYLIHSEIKALEIKLAKVEEELAHLRGAEERENKLKSQLSISIAEKEMTLAQLEDRDAALKAAKSNVDDIESKYRKKEEECDVLQEKIVKDQEDITTMSFQIKKLSRILPDLHVKLLDHQRQASVLKAGVAEWMKSTHQDMEAKSKMVLDALETVSHENMSLRDMLNAERERTRELVAERGHLKTELENSIVLGQELTGTLKAKDELSESNKALKLDIGLLQSKLKESEDDVEKAHEQLRLGASEIESLKQQFDLKQQAHESKLSDLHSVTTQLKSELKSVKNEKLAMQQKLDEFRDRAGRSDSDMTRVNDELDSVKAQLDRQTGDLEAIKLERHQLINAHQNRIEDLRESFKNKMAKADESRIKLDKILAEAREDFQKRLEEQERTLRQGFHEEIRNLRGKHDTAMEKISREHRDSTNQLRTKLSEQVSSQSELNGLRQQLKSLKAEAQGNDAHLRSEIHSLKNVISQLEARLGLVDNGSDEQVVRLNKEMADRERRIQSLRNDNDEKDKRIDELKEQIRLLQATVSQECEERMELMDSLAEAREQLLHLHKPQGGYGARTVSPKLQPLSARSNSSQKPKQSEELLLFRKSSSKPPSASSHKPSLNNSNNITTSLSLTQSIDSKSSTVILSDRQPANKSSDSIDQNGIAVANSVQNIGFQNQEKSINQPNPLQALKGMDLTQKKRLAAIMSRKK